MPSQRYERIPLNSPSLEHLGRDSTYSGGIPNTAPPSFHSISSQSPYDFPHRNDENAATILPHDEQPTRGTRERSDSEGDDGISLWGGTSTSATTSRDFNAARDDAIAQLMKRVEDLEARLDIQESSKTERGEVDIEALEVRPRSEWTAGERWNAVALSIGAVLLFMISFFTFLVLVVRAKHSGAGSN
ncbi:hypothetical protein DL95DRAFT_450228 [Leptodontidium sp. 2 PMI_412]|nr:hypothetical protein DL95DRAFT_450228 [Leptodontidium sp. 2 PMI_412]